MLTVRDESKPSFSVMLACGDKVVVGRSRVCEIVLGDQTISRKHCLLGVGEDGVLRLTDLGARHPASVGEVAVETGCSAGVPDGSQIRLGNGLSIKAECLGNRSTSSGEGDGSAVDGATKEVHTKMFGNPVPYGIAEAAPDDAGGTPDTSDEQRPDSTPPAAPSADAPGPQDETRILEPTRPGAQRRFDKPDQPRTCDGITAPRNGPPLVDQDGNAILGKTLQGKLLQPKKGNPNPAGNEADPIGAAGAGLDGGGATEGGQPNADVQDETNYVDPAELQELLKGKSSPNGQKGGNAVEAAEDCDAQDKTNYIDPAELQKLMKGKAGPFGLKRGAKGGDRSAVNAAEDGEAQDKTNYIDPAELKKLVKGKGKPPGSGRGRLR